MSKELEALKEIRNSNTLVYTPLGYEEIDIKDYYAEEFNIVEQALKEHEQHKAIKQEFGIDLALLSKALKAIKCIDHYKEKFFYVKGSSGTIYPVQGAELCYCPTKFFIRIISRNEDMRFMTYWLEDYGKTWALTKEELEWINAKKA